MKNFLNSCNSGQPADPAEVKAILFAVGACVLFISVLAAVHRSAPRRERTTVVSIYEEPASAEPIPPVNITEPPPPPLPDLNARFRVVPPNFRGINFMTRNYGNYEFSDGTSRDLVLIDGKARDVENSQQEWFDVNDVLYTDLTGDGSPEAIVLLTHLECGQRCDGGRSLLYVYSQNYPMQEILKYESGSGMEGCSLKSVSVTHKQLTLELFGKCPQAPETSPEGVNSKPRYVTRLPFFFNGEELVPKSRSYLDVTNRDEVTYGVEIHIVDSLVPMRHQL
jgi:hypothetical protein